MIKICAISDMHGYLPDIEKPFDLMLIAGDAVALDVQRWCDGSKEWYENEFKDWLDTLPYEDENSKVILIMGNHDVGIERNKDGWRPKNIHSRLIYLEDDFFFFRKGDDKICIYGTPYCKVFGRWAFMRDYQLLKEHYSKIPENIDILLTHDAPYGVSDICYDWLHQGRALEHIGNPALREAILEKNPKWNIHGHLHSANHDIELLGNTNVVNVSLLNESYNLVYKPFYFTI